MRLTKPGLLNRNSVFKVMLPIAVLLVLAFVGWKVYRHYNPALTPNLSQNADDATIREFKNSQDPVNQRSLISSYLSKGDYENAKSAAIALALKTNNYQDYLQVLTICAVRNVSSKASCIQDADNHLKPLVNSMPFLSAYTVAKLLENNGNKKDALIFYERAYDVYTPTTGAENMMTQDQLKAHINELQK